MLDTNIKTKVRMNEIVSPIAKELVKVNSELKNILSEFDLISGYGVIGHVYKNPDRLIRQAMILLPVKAIGKSGSDKELSKLCAVAEIVYSAVNLHDKINDSDKTDGKKAGNKKEVDNSHAVLNGDALQTLALLAASEIFPKNLILDITRLIEKSCYMKISEEIQKSVFGSDESYVNSLKNSAAEFSSVFALLGAYVSKASADETSLLKKCGYNLGMLYRIAVDYKNGRVGSGGISPLISAEHYAKEAESAISGFDGSVYKKSLLKLARLFYSNILFNSWGKCESEAK